MKKVGRDRFAGFCFLRAAERTFFFSGIVGKVTRMDTGELLTKTAWRDQLRRDSRVL